MCHRRAARRWRVRMVMPDGTTKDTLWQDRAPHIYEAVYFHRYEEGSGSHFPPPPSQVIEVHPELQRIRGERMSNFAGPDQREKQKRDGFVYVIATEKHPGLVKVGRSRDPIARLGSANTWCPYDSYEIAAYEFFTDAIRAEARVHQKLEACRADTAGEWFSVSQEAAVRAVQQIQKENP